MSIHESQVLCKIFPSILTKGALLWLRKLATGCIGDFNTLSFFFIKQFYHVKASKDANLRRQPMKNEKLRPFLKRCWDEMLAAEVTDKKMAALAFKHTFIDYLNDP